MFTLSALSGPQTTLPCSSGPLPGWSTLFASFRAPNCVLPASRVGVPFSHASELCTPPHGGPLPSSTRGSTLFASSRPQTPELCTPPRGSAAIPPRLQNVLLSTLLGLGDWNRQKPRTEPQEPSEKPNRMNLKRLFKTATEPNRTVTFMLDPQPENTASCTRLRPHMRHSLKPGGWSVLDSLA